MSRTLLRNLLILCCLAGSPVALADYTILTTAMPPYVNEDGKSGIALDITTEMFRRANIKFDLKVVPLARALKQAEKKEQTCVVPLQRSQERETLYKWISPVLVTQSALFSPPDAKFDLAVLADARPYKIGVYRGSALEEYLQGAGFDFDVQAANSEEKNAKKLNSGRVDIWAADAVAGPYYAKKANVRLKQQIIFSSTLRAIACHIDTPDSEVERLTDVLKGMYGDGTVKRIFTTYTKDLDVGDLGQFLN
ncbi:MAG: transporter substrate-binding domain-containing protein [Oleiphilaceae bacterium]|nr:transporter substrate-binding domain-containing protein [Oleiphilaceae bacterium]